MMTTKTFSLSLAALFSLSAISHAAAARTFVESVIDTTPAGLVRASSERSEGFGGWLDDSLEGGKAIMRDGNNVVIVPTYTIHPKFDWSDYKEENALPYGMGLGRQIIDDQGNERTLYLVNFIDSNYNLEPMVGYQWLSRWSVRNSGLHVGAGYLFGITVRDDYHWMPCPLPLPVAKVGTDTVSLYGTFIPFTNVFFFYSTITLDDQKRRDAPLPASSPWSTAENYFYGGWGWQYVDNAEERSHYNIHSDDSWHVGMRHYSGRHWATDVSYRESKHGINAGSGKGEHTHTIKTAAVQLQYNVDASTTLRLYAGGGMGYSKMSGGPRSDELVHPVLSLGGTYALSRNLFINAEMFTSFTRFKGTTEGADSHYVLKTAPTDFTLSLGYAF